MADVLTPYLKRPTIEEYMMVLAITASSRASCIRRRVGCILVNELNHVVATGYNGPPSGVTNCTDTPCAGAKFKSGQGLSICQATHAEINAMNQAGKHYGIRLINRAFVTAKPCTICFNELIDWPGMEKIYYFQDYPHNYESNPNVELIDIKSILSDNSIVYTTAKLYGLEK